MIVFLTLLAICCLSIIIYLFLFSEPRLSTSEYILVGINIFVVILITAFLYLEHKKYNHFETTCSKYIEIAGGVRIKD